MSAAHQTFISDRFNWRTLGEASWPPCRRILFLFGVRLVASVDGVSMGGGTTLSLCEELGGAAPNTMLLMMSTYAMVSQSRLRLVVMSVSIAMPRSA